MTRFVGLSTVLALALVGAACGDGESAEPTATSDAVTVEIPSGPNSLPDAGPIEVTSDVRFAEASPELVRWSDPLADVYAPQGAGDLPLVVMFPPHSLRKDNPATVQLANSVAERGAVVATVNWSELENPPEMFEDSTAVAAIAGAGQSVADCAVSFLASRAEEFGADPSRLVLVGELYGANAASMVALGPADPLSGCLAPTDDWMATGLVGVNADWLVTAPYFDAVAPTAVEVFSPWTLLDRAPMVPTRLVVTSAAASVGQRCDDRDADWMVLRDPTGAMRDELEAVGGYDDGCVDLGDEAQAMAEKMSELGFAAEVDWLTNADEATRSGSGGQVLQFGQADLNVIVDTIVDATLPV